MADSDNAVLINPKGEIGLCDRHISDELIGHIDSDVWNKEVRAKWKQTAEEVPECDNCFFYPSCYRLKHCNAYNSCFLCFREQKFRNTLYEMRNEYERWLANTTNEEELTESC